tara:strand:- start:3021 stop:3128 length:108 start_codon:yes stop_codon:yes gene_type:complete
MKRQRRRGKAIRRKRQRIIWRGGRRYSKIPGRGKK